MIRKTLIQETAALSEFEPLIVSPILGVRREKKRVDGTTYSRDNLILSLGLDGAILRCCHLLSLLVSRRDSIGLVVEPREGKRFLFARFQGML